MSTSLKPLKDQVIVVTGASSGIGLATALAAAKQNARLVLAARSEQTLREVCERISSSGGHAVYRVTDVGKRTDLEQLAQFAIETYGRIDTWINNAGVSIYGSLDEVSEEDSRRLFDVNFWGVVNGSLVALPHLRASGGALINVGSEASDAVLPLQGMYAASKHAVKGFTDALRVEVEEVNRSPVSITLVQPTAVDTPYPQHAKNYMTHEPKLPAPQIDPARVAEVILRAATHPKRDVRVGAMAKLNVAMSRVIPTLADKMAAMYATRQQYNAPPQDPEGTLYKAGESGRMHGVRPRTA